MIVWRSMHYFTACNMLSPLYYMLFNPVQQLQSPHTPAHPLSHAHLHYTYQFVLLVHGRMYNIPPTEESMP